MSRIELTTVTDRRPNTTTLLPMSEYDLFIVSFSGGKDSLALVLKLFEMGVPKEKIQLWHQSIDGRPEFMGGEPGRAFDMDWPVTEAYCRAVAAKLGVRILFQWKHGGFAREMGRENALTAPTSYQCQDGTVRTSGGVRGKLNTRKQFPQVSADLSVRWCSAYLKIDVAAMAINGDPALKGKTILYLSGERRQESAARAKYAEFEQHRTSSKSKRVDHWRAVIDMPEAEVWAIIGRHGINPHPAYHMGYGRLSCMDCIFMDANQAATNRKIAPERFATLDRTEAATGKTIKRGKSLTQLADAGTPHAEADDADLVKLALGHEYQPAAVTVTGEWTPPAGAFKASGGPI